MSAFRRAIVAVLALVAATLAASAGADGASRVPLPVIAVDKTTHCIEPPEVMRRLHPELLRHQRERTVRIGERNAKVSLAQCVECHAGKGAGVAAGAVTGSPQAFCESCHRYAAVQLDCFECHRARPAEALAASRP